MITAADRHTLQVLRPIAIAALRAPSVHNTQPWRFHLGPDRLSIRVDRSRQLSVLDPTGRQLTISCGCALFNARVAAAAGAIGLTVVRMPAGADSNVMADLEFAPAGAEPGDDSSLSALYPAILRRHTNRRRFADEAVPSRLLARLGEAAAAEGAHLVPVVGDTDLAVLAELSQLADRAQYMNPAYRAELRAWTSDDADRLDGVPALAVPHVDDGSGDEIPIRDFDTRGAGALPTRTASTRSQCLVLIGTDLDEPLSWLRAGEALERVLLEVAAAGLTSSPLTQVVEVPAARAELRKSLELSMYPHVLLRIGKALPTAGSPRRHLMDVLVEHGSDGVAGG